MEKAYVIGLDYGTDSVRAVLVNAVNGEIVDEHVHNHARWSEGKYCDPAKHQFRQHPLDYIEGLENVLCTLMERNRDLAPLVKAISLDTTASTPCMADKNLTPLSMHDKYKDNPDAMFVLWKDHTGVEEAAQIEKACYEGEYNYAEVSGYHYSAECFWAKVLHVLRNNPDIREDAYTVIDCCDWIPALLTGNTDPEKSKICHCGAGQKMFWNEKWGGFPPEEWFAGIDPVLVPVLKTMKPNKYTCDKLYGTICQKYAQMFGLNADVKIGVGNIDSHLGAIGAGVAYRKCAITLGTSAGCMLVVPPEKLNGRIIDGVFGQVDSCILPGMIGFEVGVSAFGDAYAWFKRLLSYPVNTLLMQSPLLDAETKEKLREEISDKILYQLGEDASKLPLRLNAPFATDWLNGRRSPEPNQQLWASMLGMNLSTTAPELYYALVEATAFAFRTIVDHMEKNDCAIDTMIGVGGISQKSPFVMQMIADITGKTIEVSSLKSAPALGSAICAAVIAGLYPSVEEAQKAMCQPILKTYVPRAETKEHFEKRYKLYQQTGKFTEMMLEHM